MIKKINDSEDNVEYKFLQMLESKFAGDTWDNIIYRDAVIVIERENSK
jgi:hypothetical protein